MLTGTSYAQSAYWNQQMMRQQQMANQRAMQAQQDARRQAERQAQMRRQDDMRRQQEVQRRAIQERQRLAREQMQKRQKASIEKRQKAIKKQRTTQQQRLQQSANNRANSSALLKPNTPSIQKAAFERRTLRQQRLAKVRTKRFEKLRLQRQINKQKSDGSKAAVPTPILLSSLASRSVLAPVAPIRTTSTLNELKKVRFDQKSSEKLTNNLATVRKSIQDQAKRTRENQRRTKLAKNATKNRERAKETKALKLASKVFGVCTDKKCTCSFHGDTHVVTSNGPIPIKDVVEGQTLVWARDEYSGETGWKAVNAHYSSKYDWMVVLELEDAQTGERQKIRSNKIHPFFVKSNLHAVSGSELAKRIAGDWTEAVGLRVGDKLAGRGASVLTVVGSRTIYEPFEAYNLSIEEYATYFVQGNLSIDASGIWVHNECNDKQRKEKLDSLTKFKGRDALRRENKVARDAVKSAGLSKDQAQQLHREISKQGYGRDEIFRIAREIKGDI